MQMCRKRRSIDEIYDVRGLRLIVKDKESCYAALEQVHRLWSHIPRKYKDYIASPKSNG
jgi:GTP pyrophosphokinase